MEEGEEAGSRKEEEGQGIKRSIKEGSEERGKGRKKTGGKKVKVTGRREAK